jgi:hypothetical protein
MKENKIYLSKDNINPCNNGGGVAILKSKKQNKK